MTGVVGETSREPCDELPGAYRQSKEFGARFLVTHGGVADYVLVCRGHRLRPRLGRGRQVLVQGDADARASRPSTRPIIPERTTLAKSPNMIVAAAAAIHAIENWADAITKSATSMSRGRHRRPEGANRRHPRRRPQSAVLLPANLRSLSRCPLGAGTGSALHARRDRHMLHAARPQRHGRDFLTTGPATRPRTSSGFAEMARRAHRANLGEDPQAGVVETSSMWRDINVFNEVGIPAMTYGPRATTHQFKRALTIESLYQAALSTRGSQSRRAIRTSRRRDRNYPSLHCSCVLPRAAEAKMPTKHMTAETEKAIFMVLMKRS